MWKSIVPFAILAAVFSGCANENSNEQVRREKLDRQRARYQPATGSFQGYLVKRGTGQRIPFSMNVSTVENPSTSDAILQVSMTLGLFGGVSLTSNLATYDYGVGRLNAYFSQNAAAGAGAPGSPTAPPGSVPTGGPETSTVEIEAFYRDNQVTGSFRTSHSGMFDLALGDSAPDFSETSTQMLATFKTPGSEDVRALLTLNQLLQTQPSKVGMDLPVLPALTGTLQFEYLSAAVLTFTQVLYDPLKGEIEMDLVNNNRLMLRDVFLPKNSNVRKVSEISGKVLQGGAVRANVSARATDEARPVKASPAPYYEGTVTSQSGRSQRVVGALIEQPQILANPGNFIFPQFPLYQIALQVCQGGTNSARIPLSLGQLDQLTQQSKWISAIAGRVYTYDSKIGGGWQRLTGDLSSSSESSPIHLKLSLRAAENAPVCH